MHMLRSTVHPEHVARTEKLVRAIIEELREVRPPGLRYAAFKLDDGVSFVHLISRRAHASLRGTRAGRSAADAAGGRRARHYVAGHRGHAVAASEVAADLVGEGKLGVRGAGAVQAPTGEVEHAPGDRELARRHACPR